MGGLFCNGGVGGFFEGGFEGFFVFGIVVEVVGVVERVIGFRFGVDVVNFGVVVGSYGGWWRWGKFWCDCGRKFWCFGDVCLC